MTRPRLSAASKAALSGAKDSPKVTPAPAFAQAEAPTKIVTPKIIAPKSEPRDDAPEPFDLDKIVRAAAVLAPGMFGFLLWVDLQIVAHGWPPMSDWWRAQLRAFYESGKRIGLFRVGRGGGKSTTLERVSITEGMFTERVIPPGQRWIYPFISVGTEDAGRRITELGAFLHAIGKDVKIKRPNGRPTIELTDARGQPIAFVALASTIAGVSGPSTIGFVLDEEAKLRDKTRNANPASEILASLIQTFRARPNIHGIRCSSAWTEEGSHCLAIKEGATDMTFVAMIGEEFIRDALDGLAEVAGWEAARGDTAASSRIRAYAATLTADSPNVPTWVAHPAIGALASRALVDALPKESLDGLSRLSYWLRENVSIPMSPGVAAAMSLDDLKWFAEHANPVRPQRRVTIDGGDESATPEADLIAGRGRWGDGAGNEGQGGRGPCL